MTPRERAYARLSAMSPLPGISALVEALEAALIDAEEQRDLADRWRKAAESTSSRA
jgi:hypothetical protein